MPQIRPVANVDGTEIEWQVTASLIYLTRQQRTRYQTNES